MYMPKWVLEAWISPELLFLDPKLLLYLLALIGDFSPDRENPIATKLPLDIGDCD